MAMNQSQYDYSQLSPSTPIMMFADVTRREPAFGFVTRVKNRGCDCLVVSDSGGIAGFRDCWHIDDPRIVNQPEVYREVADTGDRGVFELAPAEVARREMVKLIQSLPVDKLRQVAESYGEATTALDAYKKALESLQSTVEEQGRKIEGMNARIKELGSGRSRSA